MSGWTDRLRLDPVPPLLAVDDPALTWCIRRELLDERDDPRHLWRLPAVDAVLRRQQPDGSWRYSGRRRDLLTQRDYDGLATYTTLLPLVYQHRLDRRHPAVRKAAEFLLGFQTGEGDLRGIYGSQYSPNYTAAMLAVLIDAGYARDPRVELGIRWLLSMRQDDGGWAIPVRTHTSSKTTTFALALQLSEPLQPDRAKPFSHLVTDIVLRALAAHPRYRSRPESVLAAKLLASRFFRADAYPDRRDAAYWEKLRYPFRWTDVGSALDSILRVGIGRDDPRVEAALEWLAERQGADGLWRSTYEKARERHIHHWTSFAIASVFRRAYEPAEASGA